MEWSNRKQISTQLTDEIRNRLQLYSQGVDIEMFKIINAALDEYLSQEPRKRVIAATREFQESLREIS